MKKKSLLLSSLALLVVSAIAFTGATYAWFVAGAAPSVDELQARVADAGVIKIAALPAAATWNAANYATEFGTSVSVTQLRVSEGVNNPNWLTPDSKPLNPVSAIDATPTLDGAALNYAAGALGFINEAHANDAVNFIKYDLFFSNESTAGTNYTVSLNVNLSRFFVDGTSGYYGGTTQMSAAQQKVIKSLRLALVSDQLTTAINPRATVDGGYGVIVYEPDPVALSPSDKTGWTPEQLAGGDQAVEATYPTIAGASDAGVTGQIDLFVISSVMTGTTVDPALFATRLVKLTVYLWVEGNDLDCLSGVAGGFFSNALQFGVTVKD